MVSFQNNTLRMWWNLDLTQTGWLQKTGNWLARCGTYGLRITFFPFFFSLIFEPLTHLLVMQKVAKEYFLHGLRGVSVVKCVLGTCSIQSSILSTGAREQIPITDKGFEDLRVIGEIDPALLAFQSYQKEEIINKWLSFSLWHHRMPYFLISFFLLPALSLFACDPSPGFWYPWIISTSDWLHFPPRV